ncbi:MAG: DinB family protein [Ornithinibacter sp.]
MSDLWQPDGDDPRDFSATRGEQQNVLTYLRNYRHAFRMKCAGLDAGQLASRSVPPSTLSLLGLVRHLSQMEHHWSVQVLQGRDEPRLYHDPEDRDADFNGAVAEDSCVAEAWATYERVAAAADAWYDLDTDWDRLIQDGDEGYEVRDIMVHVVEEYARHVGHADLLRECIDGRTGQ